MDKPNIRYNVTGDHAITVSQVHEVAKSTETPWWGEDLKGMYPRAEDYPRLPDEDFERKFGQLRQVMQIEDLDCLIIAGRAATVWISGYFDPFTNVGYVIFPREGEPILIENFGHHTPTAKAISYIRNFREGWRVKLETFAYDEAVVDSLNEFGIESGRVGICGWDIWEWEPSNFMPAKVMDALKREFPKVEFPFFDDLIMRLARVHSEHEMVFVEKSADMLDKMFEELESRVKPGMLECEVWGIVKYVMYREGGDDPFSQLIVSHPQSAPVGARFGATMPPMRELKEGDIITGEYSSRFGGYCTQSGHPISLGKPMQEWVDLYDVGVEALYAAVDKLRPGNTFQEARHAGRDVYIKENVYGRLAGHLMGIQVERIGPNEPFEPGMTVALHSWPYSQDYGKGHFIGDTFQITDGAPVRLNKFPEKIIEV